MHPSLVVVFFDLLMMMMTTLRHTLRKPSSATASIARAFSQGGGRGNWDDGGLTDQQLHQSYEGFMPRFEAARALLFTQEGEDKFEMYVDAKIGGSFLSKMRVLTDLEHPLFLKVMMLYAVCSMNIYIHNMSKFSMNVMYAQVQIRREGLHDGGQGGLRGLER